MFYTTYLVDNIPAKTLAIPSFKVEPYYTSSKKPSQRATFQIIYPLQISTAINIKYSMSRK